ncbi:uncharacterized protein LOC106517215 [Austrofundulus limnaeus]|uniref:Uncharacterized protein LOC106517215 n=1 Tax=Austrofundulus limnaeus TaxID=52670 RepID=A0A2I4B6M8_AUSLI|nr:PREDICTED: uncharacterized protein LOC106517215 [Austrofundulus limnaeus]
MDVLFLDPGRSLAGVPVHSPSHRTRPPLNPHQFQRLHPPPLQSASSFRFSPTHCTHSGTPFLICTHKPPRYPQLSKNWHPAPTIQLQPTHQTTSTSVFSGDITDPTLAGSMPAPTAPPSGTSTFKLLIHLLHPYLYHLQPQLNNRPSWGPLLHLLRLHFSPYPSPIPFSRHPMFLPIILTTTLYPQQYPHFAPTNPDSPLHSFPCPATADSECPIGIATQKYSGKKRLTIDLSAPHGSHVPSINSLIPFSDFFMQYATVDHTIRLIRLVGRGAWLSKAAITSAFRFLPIHPDFWRLFDVYWKGTYYFAVRLTFCCRSSPKIFDSLSEALCWILLNNFRLPYVLHLLDDFLIITPTTSSPCSGLCALTHAFSDLGVPLSEEKTIGPLTSLEFLGITLDSSSFQASLPPEKVHRITLILSNFMLIDSCTKHQLLSLLGHLNYAMHIIPQGKSFISHLLSTAASVPSLHGHLTLGDACRMEIKLWHHFLSSWNGISFFYNDFISHPDDIQLYTDATPSIGFGGFHKGRWFASTWLPEVDTLQPDSASPSSALYELYPVVIAALLWGYEWSQHSILIHFDNTAVVKINNKGRSHSLAIIQLMRRLTLVSAHHQFLLRAAHFPGYHNHIADALSRFSFQKFRALAPTADPHLTPVPPFSATIFNWLRSLPASPTFPNKLSSTASPLTPSRHI